MPSLSRFSLKQSLNLPGITKAFQAIFEPSLVMPQIQLSHVNKLDLIALKQRGISCLCFDKDNTLTYTYIDELHPSCTDKVAESKRLFPQAVAILSNSVGSCDDVGYAGALATEAHLKLPVIRHKLKKPACLHEVIEHFEASLGRPVHPREICMIGDRVLTDVMFGNQYGMLSVLVGPLSLVRDHPLAVVIRWLETKLLLPFLRLLGVKPKALAATQASSK
jgi:phosphatidylglycerophosphatase GEP4